MRKHYKQSESILEEAIELVGVGDRRGARRLLEPFVESRGPGYAQAVIPLALLMERAGEMESAARLYRIGMDSGDSIEGPQAAINLGCLLRDDLGDLGGAREAFEQAARSGHRDITPAAINNLAAVARLQGNANETELQYRQVVASEHPDYAPVAMLNLAGVLEHDGDIEGAREWYKAALATGHQFVASDARSGLVRLDSPYAEEVR